jgi:(p)ppGpp synthase/HD superfamily hydrolase
MNVSEIADLREALARAQEWHGNQVRKGTDIPYLSHLLGVAALVMEDGGTHDQVVAALLHDAAEDQGGETTLAAIGSEFGSRVATIVRACSDSLEAVGVEKAPWKQRKERALSQLEDAPPEALIVVAADKLHNLRSTVTDLSLEGESVWDRFNAGRDDILWYYDAMHEVLERHIPHSRSVRCLGLERNRLTEVMG